jgi:hypothetical protein
MFEQEGTEEREDDSGSASVSERHFRDLEAQGCADSVAVGSNGFHFWQEDDWQEDSLRSGFSRLEAGNGRICFDLA